MEAAAQYMERRYNEGCALAAPYIERMDRYGHGATRFGPSKTSSRREPLHVVHHYEDPSVRSGDELAARNNMYLQLRILHRRLKSQAKQQRGKT